MNYELAKKLKDASKNGRWKGETASYVSKHQFLTRNFGKPKQCSMCWVIGRKEKGSRWSIHWAKKIGQEYTHNREDYLELCRVCHGKYDMTDKKRAKLREMALNQKGSKSATKSRIALSRKRDNNGHFIKTKA